MSYSDPIVTVYSYGHDNDMGNGTPVDWSFKGPVGKKGMLKDIGIHVTEVFACDQVVASLGIGTSRDPDAYGLLNMPDGTAATNVFNIQDDTDCIISEALCKTSILFSGFNHRSLSLNI